MLSRSFPRAFLPVVLLLLAVSTALGQSERLIISPDDDMSTQLSRELLTAKRSIDLALYSISHQSAWVEKPTAPDTDGMEPDEAKAAQKEYQRKLDKWKTFDKRLQTGNTEYVMDMLRRKIEEGVKVRLILNGAGHLDYNISRARAFEKIGVEVAYTDKTMHHKFAIIDKKRLITGSGNWSRGADQRYSENTIVYDKHWRLVRQFRREFNYLWKVAHDWDEDTIPGPDAEQPEPKDDGRWVYHSKYADVEAYFTSENRGWWEDTCADQIIDMMWQADDSITIMVNHFNMRDIAKAVVKIDKKRNQNDDPDDDVEIKVLLDLGELDADISQSHYLEKHGINVRYKMFSQAFYYPVAQFMHHKILIVDSDSMITGSYNWSFTAEHRNYENITVHRGESQQDLIDEVEEEFDKLWGLNRDKYEAFKKAVLSEPEDDDYRRWIPIHFHNDSDYFSDPMTLTRDEIQPIRDRVVDTGFDPSEDSTDLHYDYLDKETGQVTNSDPEGTFLPEGADDDVKAKGDKGIVDALDDDEKSDAGD